MSVFGSLCRAIRANMSISRFREKPLKQIRSKWALINEISLI